MPNNNRSGHRGPSRAFKTPPTPVEKEACKRKPQSDEQTDAKARKKLIMLAARKGLRVSDEKMIYGSWDSLADIEKALDEEHAVHSARKSSESPEEARRSCVERLVQEKFIVRVGNGYKINPNRMMLVS